MILPFWDRTLAPKNIQVCIDDLASINNLRHRKQDRIKKNDTSLHLF